MNNLPHWPDARGWIGISVFVMSIMLLWMMKDPALREDEFFQTIATLVIGTGFIGGVVSWAYAATKGGGEAAESSARIAEKTAAAMLPIVGQPAEVKVVNPPDNPANVQETRNGDPKS